MVLLKGKNYDFTGQVNVQLTEKAGIGSTTLKITNNDGFADNDYIVIEPYTSRAEIVKISSSTITSFTVAATQFAHDINSKIWRLPYNQIRFYESSESGGTFTVVTDSTIDMDYRSNYTNFGYAAGDEAYYFKRTFYNSTSTAESDIDIATQWQNNDEYYYVNPEELRTFLQFGENDYPTLDDMRYFIKVAQININLDVDSSNEDILFFATLLYAKSLVLRGLATKSVAKGYITVNAEGRNITKAYQELVLEAENTESEYKAFLDRNTRREATKTNFMDDTTQVTSLTRQDFIDWMNGTSNAIESESGFRFGFSSRASRRSS